MLMKIPKARIIYMKIYLKYLERYSGNEYSKTDLNSETVLLNLGKRNIS